MINALFWILVGILIGWNFPRPEWAKAVQEKVVQWFKNVFKIGNKPTDNE